MVLYEYPFSESIRTMLRLEHLFDKLGQLIARDTPVDHHYAISTIFEIMDVAARADLKSDLLKELDVQRNRLNAYRGNPAVSLELLNDVVGRIDTVFQDLNQLQGKAGASLTSNDWLMSIRSRISIPGGTCEFDLPAYYAWQQRPAELRRQDLLGWVQGLIPLQAALDVLLGLLRDAGNPQRVVAAGGQFQQSLPQGKSYALMRVRVDDPSLVPEITGHRLMVSVRLMRQEPDGRLRPLGQDGDFELTLCQ